MNQENNQYNEYEIDLREYILLIWEKKFILIGIVIAAMIAAIIFTNVTSDPKYEASSTLLIMPPMYTTSIEVGSLPIDTYGELARTSQMRNKIIKELDLRNEDGELINQSVLENRMEFEIAGRDQVEREGEMVEAPLIRLNAIHEEPEIAAEIANTWADFFMEDTREVRRAETTEISSLIESRFEDTRERLADAREELKDFLADTRLNELRMNLSAEEEQLENIITKEAELELDVVIIESRLKEIEVQLNELNINDSWTGELSAYFLDSAESSKMANRYKQSRENLLEHRQEYDLDLIEEEVNRLRNSLLNYRSEIEDIQREITVNNRLHESVVELLDGEPEIWELERSLSEEAVWQELFNPEELEAIGSISLREQIVNPLYEEFKNMKYGLTVDQAALKEELNEIEKGYEVALENLENHRLELNEQKEVRERLISDRNYYKEMYNQEADFYTDLENEYKNIRSELRHKEVQLATVKEEKNRLSKIVAERDNQIREYEIVEEDLNQQISDYQESYNQLASRVEEARLAQAEQTSDVKFIADAVVPDRATIGVGNTILNMAVAAVLAGMIGVFGVFFAEFIKEE